MLKDKNDWKLYFLLGLWSNSLTGVCFPVRVDDDVLQALLVYLTKLYFNDQNMDECYSFLFSSLKVKFTMISSVVNFTS